MKRAIVQLLWGSRHLAEAEECAKRSVDPGVPRICITDTDTAKLVPVLAPTTFSETVCVDRPLRGLLAKACLGEWLPDRFDSFLFLDTDTQILDDISYGFERSEAFGLAAVMAPHFSLDHFWGFGSVMDHSGVERRSQLQYNTGVIFFSRRADVWRVLRRWSELACRYERSGFSDQPFLTLAIEQMGFNPFTLSPSYNYRALGELASGRIRIWHSRAPVPADVNDSCEAWPARRFVGSRLAKHHTLS